MTTLDTRPRPPIAALRDAVGPPVVLPGEAGWDEARTPWNLAVDQRPEAVVLARTAADVQATVRFALAAGLQVVPQGTGHGAAPMGDLSGAILLRTTAMRAVEIRPEARIARAKAGAEWADVVGPATAHGLVPLHGSSPDVGVVGYSLGGGIGWMARRHGLATSHVTAVELVTGDGELLRADAESHADLFWAIRGGGGNFGVVTALEFRLFPLESAYAGWLIWPWEDSRRVMDAWSAWTRDLPDEMTSLVRILQLPPLPMIPEPLRGRRLVVVEAAWTGDPARGPALLAPLRALAPEMDTFDVVPAAALAHLHADPEEPVPGVGEGAMFDAFPPEAVEALAQAAGPGSGSPLLSVEVRHLGGALARPAPGAGALSHLDGGFAMFAVGLPMDAEQAAIIARHLRVVTGALAPWGRGRRYENFSEDPHDAAEVHRAETVARLREIRDRHDAGHVVRGRQRLGG